MNWRDYEAMSVTLYRVLGEEWGTTIVGYGANCRKRGKSGVLYQIDVLVRQSTGLQPIHTAIECKYLQRKVTAAGVSKLATTIEDIGVEKGVMIAKEGFTKGAIQLARAKNISLVEMREPRDADWDGKIKEIPIEINCDIPVFYDIEFVQDPLSFKGTEEAQEVPVPGQSVITEPGGKSQTLDGIINSNLDKATPQGQVVVNFPKGTSVKIAGYDKKVAIAAVRVKVEWHTRQQNFIIDIKDFIYMIVEEIFEQRQFHIGYDDSIVELDTDYE